MSKRNTTGRREFRAGTWLDGWGKNRKIVRRQDRARQKEVDEQRAEESESAVEPFCVSHEHRWAYVRRPNAEGLLVGSYECLRRGCTQKIEEVDA